MVKPAYDSRTNNNEAQLDIKPEHDITRLLKDIGGLKGANDTWQVIIFKLSRPYHC